MQELHLLIKQRFQKVKELIKKQTSTQVYQALKEQQKIRCQKECWILSMLRSKKSVNFQNKMQLKSLCRNFYLISYKIMQIIDQQFQLQQPNITDQTFLNDFVCLYTTFFDKFQSKFCFKIKIKNLLRPTNHYIINDLIKYLADFSRDYYQQIFFWHVKIIRKNQQQKDQERNNAQKLNLIPEKSLQNYKNSLYSKKISEQNQIIEIPTKKPQFNRLYNILDIQTFSQFVIAEKIKYHVDTIKLKMNQMYRDSKYRNNVIKATLQDYYNDYFPNFQPKSYLVEDSSSNISFPFKVTLTIEKNGFSCLNLSINDQKNGFRQERNLSPLKQKKYSSFSTTKQVINPQKVNQVQPQPNKKQIMLNSLKVLRVSENFLPPLLQGFHENKLNDKKQKMDKKRSSFSKTENVIQQIAEQHKQYYKDGLRYYNQQLSNESQKLLKQKRKIKDLRHQFTSQQKLKRTKKLLNDPQDKILQWLDRINTMKKLERKKIMGLI